MALTVLPRCRDADKRDAGLTLLELMIASGIMGMAFLYLFGAIASITNLGSTTQKRAIAQSQLSSILETVRTLSYAQLKAYTAPTVQGLGATATARVEGFSAGGAAMTFPVPLVTVFPNPVEVRVTITWRDARGRTNSLSESSLFRR